jgi:diaminopimelate decarboxylase
MKANPHDGILRTLRSLGSWIDVSSAGEYQRAIEAGFEPHDLSFVGPGKSDAELSLCIDNGVHCVIIESIAELLRLAELARSSRRDVRAAVRVNPSRYLNYQGIERVGAVSHFGIDEEQLGGLLALLPSCPEVRLIGLQFFLHSQFLNASHIGANFRSFLGIADRFQQSMGKPLELINLGGGFGIPYFEGQPELDLDRLQESLLALLQTREAARLPECRFFVESGRFITGPCGVFGTRVLYRKESRDKTFLVCDGGMTQHLAAIGVGQMIRRNFPLAVLHRREQGFSFPEAAEETEMVNIVGPSCFSLDVLASEARLPRAERGDLVCIGQSGAYGPTFSPQGFLSRPPPAEFFLSEA